MVSRRDFMMQSSLLGGGAILGTLVPGSLFAGEEKKIHINMHHIHTGERLHQKLSTHEMLDASFQAEMNRFLRDWRLNQKKTMSPKLIQLATEIYMQTGATKPMEIVCGYRAPKTNKALAAKSRGVASNSFHLKGQALDFHIPGVPLRALGNLAKSKKAGGVGIYPASHFIHVDVRGYPASW